MLADLILIAHTFWVLFIVLSVPLIVLGKFQNWQWVRNRWYRLIHIVMMGLVAVESLLAITCPLTLWENVLRAQAQHETYEQSFISYWFSHLIYYELNPWIFTVVYVLFFALILFLYFWAPPKTK